MSQTIWSTINPASTSGTQLATLLDDFKEAMVSGMSGTARPTQLDASGAWIDTTNGGSPNFYWSYKIYTGTIDIEVFRVNLATSTVSISGADTTFEIKRYSADTVGPILQMAKRRIASNGQILIADTIGTIQFIGRGSDSSNPVVAYIDCVASDNFDGTKSGGYLRFLTTPALAAAAVEHMRLIDGKLGVGTASPNTVIHAVGATGIKAEYIANDAIGAKISTSKSRIAGTGATQSSDVIGQHDFYTTDDASAKVLSAQVVVSATQAHTASARGTQLDFKVSTTGTTTPTSKMVVGDKVETVTTLKQNSSELVSQNIATAASIIQLSATKAVVEFTGSTTTDLKGINSGHDSKVILLHNRSTAYVNLLNENASAAAADRLKLPLAASIFIPPEGSVELYYCTTDTRWKTKSAAIGGSGGSGGVSMDWYFGESNVPEESIQSNGLRVIKFAQSPDEQEMFVEIKVPASYVTGTQIKLIDGKLFASQTTGNVLFRATSYIMKATVDGTSTPVGYDSTNTQVAVSGTTNLIVATGDIDLTDATGLINAVAVAAGNVILTKLIRDTSAETSGLAGTANFIRASFEPKFTA